MHVLYSAYLQVFWKVTASVTTICKPISLINILRISGGGAVRTDFSETIPTL